MSSRTYSRNIRINALGLLGKVAGPVFLVVVTRLYGADGFGLFLSALVLVEMSVALLTSGFQDGALLFSARSGARGRSVAATATDRAGDVADAAGAEGRSVAATAMDRAGDVGEADVPTPAPIDFDEPLAEPDDATYASLGTAVRLSVGAAFLLMALAWLVAPLVLPRVHAFGADLSGMLSIMAFGLLFFTVERNLVAATMGRNVMTWDALIAGGLRPAGLLIFSFVYSRFTREPAGLAMAYVTTQMLGAVVAMYGFGRLFQWRRLVAAVFSRHVDRELVAFAWPQSLTMTLSQFLTGVDVLMLGALGLSPAAVGVYGAGSQIVRNLRMAKVTFSVAFSPQVPALLGEPGRARLRRLYGQTSGMIAGIGLPVVLLVALWREPLLRLVVPEGVVDADFMLPLLLVPTFLVVIGLAQNVITMAGHARWNLGDTALATIVNVVLNLAFIPMFGLAGAAVASAIASGVLHAAQTWQASRWLGLPLRWPDVRWPMLGFLVGGAVVLAGELAARGALGSGAGSVVGSVNDAVAGVGLPIVLSLWVALVGAFAGRLLRRSWAREVA